MATRQARMPAGSKVISIVAGSMESTRSASANASAMSSRVSRCGPLAPVYGSRSPLKQT
ncbi:hypothetical protein [Streptomyces sp. NPDC060027]|uniref:hypothetical protein n=1 Tax=Streptomyces sp. NPDC060027 TaxID=3347040 RepID=UPI0036CF02D7